MGIEDENFFEENVVNINKKFTKFLFWMTFIPIFLFVFTKIGVFEIPDVASVSIFAYTVIAFVLDFLFAKSKSKSVQSFLMYFGLYAIEIFIVLMGAEGAIGIYLTFGLVPVLSCLYYNRKLTNIINFSSYVLMLVSMYVKWLHNAPLFDRARHDSFNQSYIPIIIGMTIEFVFIVLSTNMHSSKNFRTLQTLLSSNIQKKQALDVLRRKVDELKETQFKILEFVAKCLGSHDLFTGTHVVHTQTYVRIIALKLRENGFYKDELSDKEIRLFQQAAFLHDIGKLHVPEGVLNKIGRYNDEERKLMNSHPEEGKKLLESLPIVEKGEFNEIAIKMAYCHHEKWDGTGYPQGLKGKEIPLCARIMAAADVLDALISQRLYKDPMSMDQAMKVFEESNGSHFEPCIAQATIESRSLIEEEDRKFKEIEKEKYATELQWWKEYHKNAN